MGDWVVGLDTCGAEIGLFEVESVETIPESDRTLLVRIIAPKEVASQVAGIRVQDPSVTQTLVHPHFHLADDIIVCRCERVTAAEIRGLIRQGYRDINAIKILSRAGMGACGSKTCGPLIQRLFREEGISDTEVVPLTRRPLFVEVPLGVFAGVDGGEPKKSGSSVETIPQVATQRENGSHE